jgi:hypothetical protein
MSLNKYLPHLLVLPEDDANRQIATGFSLDSNLNPRLIQVLPPPGGWKAVIAEFEKTHISAMQQFTARRIVLLIDFDERENRFSYVQAKIPDNLQKRVFILGVASEPENLKRDTQKTFEQIGKALAQDCVNNTNELWGHDLLKHNKTELERMIADVKPFLFN